MGGSNVANAYADSQLAASACAGTVKGACALTRIQAGQMPAGAGCSGNPATDVNNAACLTQEEQDALSAWITAGFPE